MYKKLKYNFLTVSELKPAGWLREQLRLQADGLSGNLDKVWPDVRNSAWIGGCCEGWERVPYWLDGFIPLAYLLEDDDMIRRAQNYIDAILERQNEDGWICPCSKEERGNYDTWAALLILKVLALYGDCSGDPRAEDAVERALKNLSRHLDSHTLRDWGAARWFEGLISIFWLYDRKPSGWLLLLAEKLKCQGFNWKAVFETRLADGYKTDEWNYFSHVVNIGMMLKSEALFSRIADIDPEELADAALAYLEEHHGTAYGHFTGDECLAGNSPIRGSELCGVVEAMFSYEHLFSVTGSPKWLDRLEKLAFNALPAAVSPDMWSHQYDQMSNQAASFPMSKQPFGTNGSEAHLFGLEPNFGCCTANFGQGWPKLALTSFMRCEDGIASCALVPAKAETEIGGVSVTCELITEYPFRGGLTYRVTAAAPTDFTLSVRIPSWAVSASVDGEEAAPGSFFKIARKWEGTCCVRVSLEFEAKILRRPNNMVCVWRGPLVYSLPVEEEWERVEYTRNGVERKFPYCDYYIYPKSKWNYGLAGDAFAVTENEYGHPFTPSAPPISLTADMAEIEWGFRNGRCDAQPSGLAPKSAPIKLKLIPYGCTNLRMTEFPYIKA